MSAVLQSETPSFTEADADRLAVARFGVAGSAKLLTSERDQNFHLRGADGREYVLKIANVAEEAAVIAFQTAVLEHIATADAALPTPRVVRALDGASSVIERGSIVRLLTWLGGSLMHQVERTAKLRMSLGGVHGRLARALSSFAGEAPAQELLWDLQHFARLRPLLAHIEEAEARAKLERVLDRFDAEAAPALGGLRSQVIHNDLNPHNVVVDTAGVVSGVIDFGDMVRAPLVCDVAVAAAYHVRADDAVLADAGQYVTAFHKEMPLEPGEVALLPLLIQTRLAMTALITNWRATLYPHNRAYILRNAPAAWAGLHAFSAAPARLEIAP